MLARLASLATVAGLAAGAGTCDENCVCDGVDLSKMTGADITFSLNSDGARVDRAHPFKIAMCHALTADELADTSCDAKRGANIVRYKTGENSTDTDAADCEYIGLSVVSAKAPDTGLANQPEVTVWFASSEGGVATTVTAKIKCDTSAGAGATPGLMTEKDVEGGGKAYEFTWATENACTPQEPQCDGNCRCAGIDLSTLQQKTFKGVMGVSHTDDKPTGWE